MEDDELERFVLDWTSRKGGSIRRRKGLQVLATWAVMLLAIFPTNLTRSVGNFQCKQLRTRLGESQALVELAKIFLLQQRRPLFTYPPAIRSWRQKAWLELYEHF
jgi:hypothetical protein